MEFKLASLHNSVLTTITEPLDCKSSLALRLRLGSKPTRET